MTAEPHGPTADRVAQALPTPVRLLAAATAILFLAYCASFVLVQRPTDGSDIV